MKSTHVTSMGASLLLIALIGQVGSFKLAKQTAVVVQPSVQQQEEAIHREQLQQQRQFELLQQQQHQAEYQIQQQQLEADRFMKQHQAQQEFAANQGVKGAPLAPPAPLAPAPAPYRPVETYERQQYAQGPRPTIAYLLVRPPYPAPLPYDESAYRSYLPPMPRPQAYPEYPRQTVLESYGTKGGRQEEVAAPPPPPPPPQQPPVEQPALVVPISGDKHGKFKAMLDKLMSKLSFSSYEVAGEEYIYPAPNGGQVKQEAPIVQQKQPIVQQHEANIEQQQFREEEQQQKQELNLSQQQQQVSVESERDQGFDEAVKSPAAPVVQKPLEQTKQEVKEELVQQQVQQVQEQDFSRQPLAPAKGGQQPVRQQPEPIQQQRQEDTIKASRKYIQGQQQVQQQQYLQQEPLRQEQKGGF